mmetsp:Transcript_46791/g.146711  ORF Transcript_46791/g.146711 Transcript_46791/m.146711 type:complete len:398 (-) Transcript_46791:23-1216(-)
MNIAEPGSSAYAQQVALELAAEFPDVLTSGRLFDSIRGVESKLRLVETPNALEALTRFIQFEITSTAALRAVAQAAANTDGQLAASCSERVCLRIVKVPGLLEAVVERLETDVDAVRVINNLAANCTESARLFIQVPGSIRALKKSAKKFKLHAFGVINHLSRCPLVSEILLKEGFVEDILLPALRAKCDTSSNENEATIARGTLALANLTGMNNQVCPQANGFALRTIVKVLEYAIRGERFATITWLPPAVLFGLRNMTTNKKNVALLMKYGLADVIASLGNTWDQKTGTNTLELAMDCISNITLVNACIQGLWDAGIVRALQNISAGSRGESMVAIRDADRLIDFLLQRHIAVCMGQHRRMGADSLLLLLDDAVLFKILLFAFGSPEGSHVSTSL